jgi:peptidoglycan hydrolase-like protein with peptidoglycan-binding domain
MTVKRWVPLAAAALVIAAVAGVAVAARQGGGASSATPGDAPGAAPTSEAVAADRAVVTTVPAAASSPVEKVPLNAVLASGSSGDDVTRLQQRLVDLAFDPGPVDGQFGPATQSAMWAYQKLVVGLSGKDVTGKVTPELWDKMQDPTTIRPLRPNASPEHMEIYLPSQTAIVFDGDKPRLITHISTGTGKEWCEKGYCSVAITPGGVYKFGRRVDGWDESVLGEMFNPVYFNYGVAVHGAYNVPLYPASHACVRLPMHIAKYFPALVKRGDDVFVFDGKKDPEAYGAQPPPFNTKDPNATTTTSSTSTTSTTAAKTTTTTGNATTTTATSAAPTTTAPAPTTTATTAAAAPGASPGANGPSG